MSLSRRGFFKGVAGLVAGLVGSRVIGTPPPVVAAPCPPAQTNPLANGVIGRSQGFHLVERDGRVHVYEAPTDRIETTEDLTMDELNRIYDIYLSPTRKPRDE